MGRVAKSIYPFRTLHYGIEGGVVVGFCDPGAISLQILGTCTLEPGASVLDESFKMLSAKWGHNKNRTWIVPLKVKSYRQCYTGTDFDVVVVFRVLNYQSKSIQLGLFSASFHEGCVKC